MIGLKLTGAKEVRAALRYTADKVPDNARKAMRRMADRVEREAKLNTPVDLHNLENSIRQEISYGARGRLQIDVVVGGRMLDGVVIDAKKNRNLSKQQRKRRVNVDQYAMEIHENYSQMKPGDGTIKKRLENPGRIIGEKFLERALQDNRKQIYDGVFSAVMRSLKEIWGRMFR